PKPSSVFPGPALVFVPVWKRQQRSDSVRNMHKRWRAGFPPIHGGHRRPLFCLGQVRMARSGRYGPAGRDAECRIPARRLRALWTKKSTGCSGHIPLHIRRPQPMPRRPIIDRGADMSDDESRDWGINTRLAHSGHDPRAFWGFVNPPVVHASTVLYPDYDTHANGNQRYVYGTHGTPTTD